MAYTITTNPATLKTKKYKNHSPREAHDMIQHAQDSFQIYRNTSIAQRIQHLRSTKKNLLQNKLKYAKLITSEMGKTLKQAITEIEKCALLCDYYIRNTGYILQDEEALDYPHPNTISYQPLGVILLIMPWNFPFWQVFRAAIPALMAGNTVILKHASSVSGCSLLLQRIFTTFPEGSFQSLILPGRHMQQIISHEHIQKVTFTGSTLVGASIAQTAGGALKPTLLELGGNDAYLVLADADVPHAVERLMDGRMKNNGQSCIAAKRWLIHHRVYDHFMTLATQKLHQLKVGNPLRDTTDIGPLISREALEEIEDTLEAMEKAGQKIIPSQSKLPSSGHYTSPTLVEVREDVKMYNNLEIFGPIALVYRCQNLEEMIDIANDTDFGLGSGVFTASAQRGTQIAQKLLHSGSSFINDCVSSDPALPFGGIKKSGYGRELAENGIYSFCNIKTIVHK